MAKITTVKEYYEALPKEAKKKIEEIRKIIFEELPGGEEKISYGIPAVTLDKKYIIYYSGWKNHVSLYPFTADMDNVFPEAKDYKTSGKGTIQFSYDKPLPITLIRNIVQYRLKEVSS
jgi:uncharacterized protein YdhG (YjbR/CyaY superfamily)